MCVCIIYNINTHIYHQNPEICLCLMENRKAFSLTLNIIQECSPFPSLPLNKCETAISGRCGEIQSLCEIEIKKHSHYFLSDSCYFTKLKAIQMQCITKQDILTNL